MGAFPLAAYFSSRLIAVEIRHAQVYKSQVRQKFFCLCNRLTAIVNRTGLVSHYCQQAYQRVGYELVVIHNKNALSHLPNLFQKSATIVLSPRLNVNLATRSACNFLAKLRTFFRQTAKDTSPANKVVPALEKA